MKKHILKLLLVFSILSFGQENDDFEKRLKAIINNSTTFYNIDGVNFSSQTHNNEFTEKGLKKLYRKYSIKDSEVKTKDEAIALNHFLITKSEVITDNIKETNSYYFLENKSKTITVIWFGYFGEPNRKFEKLYVERILNDEIPKDAYEPITIQDIDFAGRKIELGDSCYWTNVNTVQCPYYGEMNWSVHKTLESAQNFVENQYKITKSKKGIKTLSEEEILVLFEGTETNAKKIVYDFTGMKSLLAGMSGGKTLTVYYVASKVRENYVSCCMSFWNNDTITENGLAPLLEKVMQIKK